jgi:sensor histidine kinase YesM
MTTATASVPMRTSPLRDPHDWHPLELIPFFQRWTPNWKRDLLYTFIWNSLLWAGFVVLSLVFANVTDWPRHLLRIFLIAHAIGFSIHGLFAIGELLLGPRIRKMGSVTSVIYYASIPTLGVFVGYTLSFALLDMPKAFDWLYSLPGSRSIATVSVVLSLFLLFISSARIRQREAEARLALETQRATEAERRSLEAQLRLLQAQIEPHFLYNTLGNAVSLIGPEPDKARLLLERLIDYLRATLSSSRAQACALATEFDSLKAYLELMQIRMGDRLRYRIDLPDALRQTVLPPMLLQPLVENAIQHGLEKKIEGGEVQVSATRDGDFLSLSVIDTGIGFDPSAVPRPGGGIGLANLRQRLTAIYGPAALMTLTDHRPSGVRVTLRLPLSLAP